MKHREHASFSPPFQGGGTEGDGVVEREAFYAELKVLKDYFGATPPELEATVRDPALGVEGYVVVWNTAISAGGPLEGCGKGGTRIVITN